MAAITHNHFNYQARIDFIQTALQQFGLEEKAEVTPIQYDPECPFKYNNCIYRVPLHVPITATKDRTQQPGCVPIPDGTKEIVFRLATPDAEGTTQPTRVENEVATIALVSAVLAKFGLHIVPSVYAWGSAASKSPQGWIVQKLMPAANKILFDGTSNRITALIDYDFACISHPSYEFLRSFDRAGSQFRGWSSDEASEAMALRNAKLHGFPSPLPPTTVDGVKWEVVKAWEDELEKLYVKRPRNMRGIKKVADVDTVLRSILPWRVNNSDILQRQSEEVIIRCKNGNGTHLVGLLNRLMGVS
ncbi:hypothetical protein VE03_09897 [Pseudogymnoascus sp. 23342-1-I1]|nr:hypothetical protein VE03_09897 [Pseudogymnoascus sp. 23342-1-I1]